MSKDKIDIMFEVPTSADGSADCRALLKKITELVKELPSKDETSEGWPKINLSVYGKYEIIRRLANDVVFNTHDLFRGILRKNGKQNRLLKIEGELSRKFLAVALKEARSELGLSQRQAADATGFNLSDITRIEGGTATLDKGLAVLNALGYRLKTTVSFGIE